MQWRQKYIFVFVSCSSSFDGSIEQFFLSYTYIGKALDGVLSAFGLFFGAGLCSFVFARKERAWWLFVCCWFWGDLLLFFSSLGVGWDGLGLGLPVDHTRDCGIEQMMVQIE